MLAIFFFVFREAAPVLVRERVRACASSSSASSGIRPRPSNVRYGTLALTVGTVERHRCWPWSLAVPFGLGAAIFVSEFCGPRLQGDAEDRHRAAGGHPERGLGLHRPDGDEPADRAAAPARRSA
ncbi:MAG: hypothetical protein M0C28_23205 [Candidatus Moduliflexus flocculans]|nr:hypothetical protein [Candidatus Moduliflexus flocculans]